MSCQAERLHCCCQCAPLQVTLPYQFNMSRIGTQQTHRWTRTPSMGPALCHHRKLMVESKEVKFWANWGRKHATLILCHTCTHINWVFLWLWCCCQPDLQQWVMWMLLCFGIEKADFHLLYLCSKLFVWDKTLSSFCHIVVACFCPFEVGGIRKLSFLE